MLDWALYTSQVIFTVLTTICTVFDVLLLISVINHRFFSNSKHKTPFVYITFMVLFGVIGKIADYFMVDAWPIADWIDPLDGYEKYRRAIGKQVTLITTLCYLGMIFINLLMTCHRVSILLFPVKAPQWFTDSKLFVYCLAITILILIFLLIPYYSPCSVNFNAVTSLHEANCAPDRHSLTMLQNMYLIYVPISAVVINVTMIFYIKLSRRLFKKPTSLSNATIKRENLMIRHTFFIATYLSFFEVGYLMMRIFPNQFESLPQQFQVITYHLRLFAICSLNFFVYFVETRSTRQMLKNYLGLENRKNTKFVSPATISMNNNNNYLNRK